LEAETRVTQSLPPDYFEQMFAGDPDPWQFATSLYETEKYRASMAALGHGRYRLGLEVGCANGVLTSQLAPRCDALTSIDVSGTALALARQRNADLPHVTFSRMTFPSETPEGRFDLIVLSEVVYYWDAADIAAAGAWITAHADRPADILLVHWTGATDYPQTGDEAVRLLRAAIPRAEDIRADRHDKYRLDLWRLA
jgi:SAM-dependent methyltransferase